MTTIHTSQTFLALSREERLAYIDKLLQMLAALPAEDRAALYQGDFLRTWDKNENTIRATCLIATILECLYKSSISCRIFQGGLAVSIFRDNSTRTRFSFASASSLLGLTVQDLDETKSQIAHGETVRETANMISFMSEVIGIRDDLFLHEGHAYMKQVADALTQGAADRILPFRPSIVNLQCDEDHPTQALADLQAMTRRFGTLENLRGKKVAMTWAFSPSYGKPLSAPQGVIALMTRFGMNVVLAHPPGYDLLDSVCEVAERHAKESGGSFSKVDSMAEAFADADIVYPKSWAPVNVMERRRDLLRQGAAGKEAMAALEKECIEQNRQFTSWECTEELMAKTKEGKALYMHCLPADITGVSCKQGEVQASVLDRYRVPLYGEASNKVYVIAAMMLAGRCKDPLGTLTKIKERNEPLRFAQEPL